MTGSPHAPATTLSIPAYTLALPRRSLDIKAFVGIVALVLAVVLTGGLITSVFVYRATDRGQQQAKALHQHRKATGPRGEDVGPTLSQAARPTAPTLPIPHGNLDPLTPAHTLPTPAKKPQTEAEESSTLASPSVENQPSRAAFTPPSSPKKQAREDADSPYCSAQDLLIEKPIGQGGFGLVYLAHSRKVRLDHPPRRLMRPDDSTQTEGSAATNAGHTTNSASSEESSEGSSAEERQTVSNTFIDPDWSRKVVVKAYGPDGIRQYETERKLLHTVRRCPYIVHSKCAFRAPESQSTRLGLEGRRHLLVLEYCPRGSLYNYRHKSVTELPFQRWMAQLAVALDYMHRHHIYHRDVKCGNVLVGGDWNIRLADLGLAEEFDPNNPRPAKWAGTKSYFSPERVRKEPMTAKSDFFAMGILVYGFIGTEAIKVRAPKDEPARLLEELTELAQIAHTRPVKADTPAPLEDLFRKLTDPDPAQRLDFAGIKSHAYFAGLDWSNLDVLPSTPK